MVQWLKNKLTPSGLYLLSSPIIKSECSWSLCSQWERYLQQPILRSCNARSIPPSSREAAGEVWALQLGGSGLLYEDVKLFPVRYCAHLHILKGFLVSQNSAVCELALGEPSNDGISSPICVLLCCGSGCGFAPFIGANLHPVYNVVLWQKLHGIGDMSLLLWNVLQNPRRKILCHKSYWADSH